MLEVMALGRLGGARVMALSTTRATADKRLRIGIDVLADKYTEARSDAPAGSTLLLTYVDSGGESPYLVGSYPEGARERAGGPS